MSILAPRDPAPDPDRPRPLRLRPTIAGALVALAFGSLTLGSICAAPADLVTRIGAGVFWLAIASIWVAMASCIYAANQTWIGRDHSERFEVFVRCLGVAFILFLVALVVVAQVPGVGWQP